MKKAALVVVAVVALVIGIVVGMTLKDTPGTLGPTDASAAAEIRRLEHEAGRLEAALAAAEARERDAESPGPAEPSVVETESPEAVAAALAPDERVAADAATGARFMSETYPCLERVEWKEVGTSLFRMPQLIATVARKVLAGEKPEPSTVGEISQLNGKLITAALTISEELPGHAPNGFFTDPAFMLTAIAETLLAAELPLDEGQLAALERTARAAMDRDRLRRSSYDETTWELRKIREEAELKDRFFTDAFAFLTEAQVSVLEPVEVRRRIRLSLFSSGTLLVVWARPFPFTERSEVVAGFLRTAQRTVGLRAEEEETARMTIEVWLESVRPGLTDEPGNPLDLEGMVETARVIAWGKLTQDLLESLADRLGFDESRLAKARSAQVIPVPVRRPEEGR